MSNSLLIAVAAGLGGMLGWGFADFCAKKTVDRVGEIVSLVWAHLLGALIFILIALYRLIVIGHGLDLPNHASTWLALIYFGVLQMIVYWLLYKGFSKGRLALLNPVFAAFPGLVAIMSVTFFGEQLTTGLAVALVAIFAGIILLNTDIESLKKRRIKTAPGVKEVGAAALLAAIWTIGWARFVHGHDALSYALLMYVFMAVAAFLLARILKVKLGSVRSDVWKFLFFIGLGEVIAYLAISYGYSRTTYISVVALISGAFSLPAIALAYFFLKERITRLQVGAIALIIVGICLVAIS